MRAMNVIFFMHGTTERTWTFQGKEQSQTSKHLHANGVVYENILRVPSIVSTDSTSILVLKGPQRIIVVSSQFKPTEWNGQVVFLASGTITGLPNVDAASVHEGIWARANDIWDNHGLRTAITGDLPLLFTGFSMGGMLSHAFALIAVREGWAARMERPICIGTSPVLNKYAFTHLARFNVRPMNIMLADQEGFTDPALLEARRKTSLRNRVRAVLRRRGGAALHRRKKKGEVRTRQRPVRVSTQPHGTLLTRRLCRTHSRQRQLPRLQKILPVRPAHVRERRIALGRNCCRQIRRVDTGLRTVTP